MKKRFSNLSIGLSPIVLLAAANCQQVDTDLSVVSAESGTFTLEAETAETSGPWETLEATIRVKRSTARNDDADAPANNSTVGIVTFDFPDVPVNTRMYFWANYRARNGGDDSVYIAARTGNGNFSFKRATVPITNTNFGWQKLAVEVVSGSGGSVSLALKNRESGFEVDRVVATINPDFDPDASEPPPGGNAGVFPGSNIRLFQGIGVREIGQDWPKLGWFDRAYNRHLDDVLAGAPNAFTPEWMSPILTFSITMANMFVDENKPMSAADLANENHPNYIWNGGDDGLSEALIDPRVTGAEGVKIVVVLGDSATAATRAVPNFFNRNWFFIGSNNYPNNEHLRYEIDAAREASIAIHGAFLRKFGNNPGVAALILSEYYTNNRSHWPAGFDDEAHKVGRSRMWAPIVAHAPLDDDGNRIAILQVNPRYTKDGTRVTSATMLSAGVGPSQSDPFMFLGTCGQAAPLLTSCTDDTGETFQEAFGTLPSMPSQDSRYARLQRKGGPWTDPAIQGNALGHDAGDRAPVNMENLGWYRAFVEPVSASTFTIDTTGQSLPGAWDVAGLVNMLNKFGPGGSDVTGRSSIPRQVIP